MPDLALYPYAVPPPGKVFVVRKEQPERYGVHIIVPPSYRTRKVSATGTVVAVGEGLNPNLLGCQVILAASAGQKLVFGERDERVLYVCSPAVLMAVVAEEGVDVSILPQSRPEGRFPLSPARVEAEDGVMVR
jgi:co-chaperonin GroES (HSP10)